MDTLVTIVIPVAKVHRHLLLHALESAHNQTVPIEVIVVNDDESNLTVRGATILDTGGNRGSSYARNLGTSKVTTPFVTYLDADDYLLNNAIELMLRQYAAHDEACYVYGGYYRLSKSGNDFLYRYPNQYDQKLSLERSLHLVTTLLDTDIVKQVGGFDEQYRGWEDFEFYARLASLGYCGTPLPYPVIIYDMGTGINRERHNAIKDEVYAELYQRYEQYIKGEKPIMACNTCGDKKGITRAQVAIMPPEAQDGMVVLEYIGSGTGHRAFRVNKSVYRGGNDELHKFIQVKREDVAELVNRGFFRKVVSPSKKAVLPTTQDFESWRARQPKPEVPEHIKQFVPSTNTQIEQPA